MSSCANKGICALLWEHWPSGLNPNITWHQVLLKLAPFWPCPPLAGSADSLNSSHLHMCLGICCSSAWNNILPLPSLLDKPSLPYNMHPLGETLQVIIPLNSWSNCELGLLYCVSGQLGPLPASLQP